MFRKFTRAAAAIALAAFALTAIAEPIQPFESGTMEHIVAARKGKPFVAIIWSLDCEFCGASLDMLAKTRRQRPDLNVVTISTDALDDPTLGPMMQQRLAKLGMTKDAWAFGDLPPERLRYAIDRSWHGEMPRSYWFNAKGERTVYSGQITAQIVEKYLPR